MSRVLVVLSNHKELPGRSYQTGFWFSELVHFYRTMQMAGIETEFLSPSGSKAAIDARSLTRMHLDRISDSYLDDEHFMSKIYQTKTALQIKSRYFKAITFLGGEGAVYDVAAAPELRILSREIFENMGIVSACSHGVLALLGIESSSGEPLVARKTLTSLLPLEQSILEKRKYLNLTLRDEIKKHHAFYAATKWPFTSFIVADGRIITAQNPHSVIPLAWQIIRMLKPAESRLKNTRNFKLHLFQKATMPTRQVSDVALPREGQQL